MHSQLQEDQLCAWLEIAASCGWWEPHEGICFVCERPLVQAVDAEGRLHCATDPAILCRDGWPVYAWHGVRVTQRIIEQPQDLKVDEIREEANVEVRRVMLERYGIARYLKDSGAALIHSDELGKLYRTEQKDDEPLVMVEVLNSTAEPDGTRKTYFLRVPPDMTMARQAVAWTFGMTADEYAEALICQT